MMSYITFVISILVIALGKKGMRAANKSKSWNAMRMQKRSWGIIAFILLAFAGLGSYVHTVMHIVERHQQPAELESTETANTTQSTKRNLQASPQVAFEMPDFSELDMSTPEGRQSHGELINKMKADREAMTTRFAGAQNKGNMKFAQTQAEAKQTIDTVADEIQDDIERTCIAKEQTECSNDIGCSWCEAGAVPSTCHSLDNAHRLPATVF